MSSPHKKVDILVVDDNPGKLLALESALAPLGENVVTVPSGRAALRELLDRDFATVILDVNMPGMDGFETAQLIRSRPRSAHTPIIFVSAVNLADIDALRGYSLGAVDYIFAPLIPEILRAKVAVFVELQRRADEVKVLAQRAEDRARELQTSQEQLRLAERMASIGTLSAGLGHDMGNLLLPIRAVLETIDYGALPDDVRESIERIRSCIGYLHRLASGLRLLALDPAEPGSAEERTDLPSWWADTEPLLRNALPRGVSLLIADWPKLPPVRLARHLLTQVVYNLVQNAGDAMRDRGEGHVVISLERSTDIAGDGVLISITDDGPGMTDAVRLRCLDPFFTTKTRGLSTGLGLSLAHGIVQKSGGRLAIRSAPGEGTTFSFVVPAAAEDEPAASQTRPTAILSMRDSRLESFVGSLLTSMGFAIGDLSAAKTPAARLWLADPDKIPAAALAEFIDGGTDRRILVLGKVPDELPASSAIVGFEGPPTPKTLRSKLHELVGAGAPGAGAVDSSDANARAAAPALSLTSTPPATPAPATPPTPTTPPPAPSAPTAPLARARARR